VRTTVGQTLDPSGFDCHFDRCASDGLEFEGVDCDLWGLEEEADGLEEAVEPDLEVMQCPESHRCDVRKKSKELMGMLRSRKVEVSNACKFSRSRGEQETLILMVRGEHHCLQELMMCGEQRRGKSMHLLPIRVR
jgi:hypothetical protein